MLLLLLTQQSQAVHDMVEASNTSNVCVLRTALEKSTGLSINEGLVGCCELNERTGKKGTVCVVL